VRALRGWVGGWRKILEDYTSKHLEESARINRGGGGQGNQSGASIRAAAAAWCPPCHQVVLEHVAQPRPTIFLMMPCVGLRDLNTRINHSLERRASKFNREKERTLFWPRRPHLTRLSGRHFYIFIYLFPRQPRINEHIYG